MYSTANMNLTAWDLESDDFNHDQLNTNWQTVDQHDHSAGRGVQISTPGIAAQAITSALIALAAVGNPQLATGAVGTSNIQDNAVTTPLIAGGAVHNAQIATGAVNFTSLDSNVLPLGSVILWYRGPGSGATPGGNWEIMDGRPWSSITNALGLSSGNIPDMRGVFPRGADINGNNGPAIGTTGGANSASLAHSHNVNAHSHTVPAHTHPIISDGAHIHLWQGGLQMATRTNCLPIGMTVNGSFGGNAQNTFYSMYIQNLLSNPAWLQNFPNGTTEQEIDGPANMDNAGAHTHGGLTQASAPVGTTNAGTGTDSQLGSVSILPQYVGLLMIMRCR